jgi:radical SAM protein with 4Fe4S-binding SPASM domain
MKYCASCGMPLANKDDIGAENEKGIFCKHCVDENGNVKSCQEIFNGGMEFFMNTIPNVDKNLAEKVTRKNMNMQSYWRNNNEECLKGEEATDEEFQNVLAKLKMQ